MPGARDHARGLDGRVAIVSVEEPAATRALARESATIVVVGDDAEHVGLLVAELNRLGARSAAFVGDPGSDAGAAALTEMVAELFPAADA